MRPPPPSSSSSSSSSQILSVFLGVFRYGDFLFFFVVVTYLGEELCRLVSTSRVVRFLFFGGEKKTKRPFFLS